MSAREPRPAIAFGLKIRELRLEQGLSQEQLAALAEVHRTYIGMIERGEKSPTLDSIYRFAEALKVQPYELLITDEDKK